MKGELSMDISIGSLPSPLGPVTVVANSQGVEEVAFRESAEQIGGDDARRHRDLAILQLEEYFAGQRNHFELPLAAEGTPFQQKVWQALMSIPHGQTCSYQHIANTIGQPKAVRAVGAANGKNPIAIVVPCHRVIGANGRLTGYAGGLNKKQWLLNFENPQATLDAFQLT